MTIYDDKFDPDYDDDGRVNGYSITGTRGRALYDWVEARDDAEFEALCAQLKLGNRHRSDREYARRWWRALTDEQRAAVYAYRRQWALDHPERTKEYARRAKRKRVASGKSAAYARKLRARQRAERIQAIVWVCAQCGVEHRPDPQKRLPSHAPKYCSQRCRSRAQRDRLRAREKNVGSGAARVGYGGRIELLRELGGDLTVARLVDELGYSTLYARNTLGDLYHRGHLIRPARGVYRVKPFCTPATTPGV